ncbi:Voltage-gated potassium channel Kch [Planctomycetes bacterium Pan216]|uniref:Voltage-gated potassium channel Kch n=1 Tax=Kolteria novifilia TaxID=2527975 RepID=A0A518AWX2_9BACT|nr:Voltage-gated potassium channel Kch [Planctomycetes bacterium Pan216]
MPERPPGLDSREYSSVHPSLMMTGSWAHWVPQDPYRRLRRGIFALVFTSVTGVAAYVMLAGLSFVEAFYMLIITISTVGYGEIGPISPWARAVNCYVILVGITAGAYTFGGLVQMMAEGHIEQFVAGASKNRRIEGLRDHHIICGYGRMGELICEHLAKRNKLFVLVEFDPLRASAASVNNYLCVTGDATEEETLRRAGIKRARSLVCVLPSDADNVFVTLTGRDMNPNLFITSRAEQPATEKKLLQAGADRVVAPQVIGAQHITNLLFRPTTVDILELVTGRQSVDLELTELTIPEGGIIHGQTLAQAEIRRKTGVIVVAIKRTDGELLVNPDSHIALYSGDTIVILGKRENIDSFSRQFAT